MPTTSVHQEDLAEERISLAHVAHTLQRYRIFILLALAATALAALIIGIAVYLLAPRQRTVSLPFRLEFRGADRGEYPNGLRFSVADITATPVLLDVYNRNQVSRFTTFDHFSRSLFVLEANRELERLMAEYQTKLADPKLTPIDRDRIERDFEAKRASINKSGYALQHTTTPDVARIPASLIPKILDDTLRVWARRAAIEKKVLDYRVPALTANILSDVQVTDSNYLVPLLLLRRRVEDVLKNIDDIAEIPGAELVRTRNGQKSLEEIRLELDELIRFRVEPLIATARASGLFGSSADAARIIQAQLAYDERALAAARAREAALRNALLTYESAQTPTATSTASPEPAGGARETVMPQLSETFLDRIVDLTNRNLDREYRQEMTEEIKNAALAVVPLEAAVKYDQELIKSFQAPVSGASPDEVKARWMSVLQSVRTAIEEINEIYLSASRQLYPETEMYRVLGPPLSRTYRGVSASRVALGCLLAMLVAVPVILAGALIHNRIREEELAEPVQEMA